MDTAKNSQMDMPARSAWIYFLLVFVLTVPFWALSFFVHAEGLPDNLPVTDIGATFMPMLAAMLLVYREEKWAGVRRLLGKTFDYRKINNKTWYLPIVFLMPVLYFLIYWAMRGKGLPVPDTWSIPAQTLLLLAAFFIAAAGEELGYMGYAIDPMLARWSALSASLIMGSIWAIWHFPSMIEIGQSPALMAWGFLVTVSFRVLYVWLYNNTGKCVFAVILFHAIANTGRSIFPGGRSYFELDDAAVGYSIISLAAVTVTYLWGAKTLASYRFARHSSPSGQRPG
ncbi:MAG TPA: CPBP family intramembrane glutamic endopeptidase [Gallionellaceae bacterium]